MKKILISACLTGENVKYNGGNNLVQLPFKEEELVVVCPETLGGLPVPRPPCEMIKDGIFSKDGNEFTKEFLQGAKKTVDLAKENNIKFALMKERSPSCGVCKVYDGTFSNNLIDGKGKTTQLLEDSGVKCFSEFQIDLLEKALKNNNT
ncbi:MAG: DUF523 domain-containing protein [Campylobacterales bacterium]|nr:DUF523 domain-containing protein [Campylobacterales bacterium]